MFIVIEMIMIISLFSAMGILLGLFLAKIRCRKREKLYYRKQGKICEDEFVKKLETLNQGEIRLN